MLLLLLLFGNYLLIKCTNVFEELPVISLLSTWPSPDIWRECHRDRIWRVKGVNTSPQQKLVSGQGFTVGEDCLLGGVEDSYSQDNVSKSWNWHVTLVDPSKVFYLSQASIKLN